MPAQGLGTCDVHKDTRAAVAQAEADGNDMLKALTLARATQSVREQLQKTGDHYKRALVEAQEKGVYTEAEAAGLVKVIAGLVESRVAEIRKSRGQRRA